MRIYFFTCFIGSLCLTFSCKNEPLNLDNIRFCDCLIISEQLNEQATKYGGIAIDEINDADIITLKRLIRDKDSICEPYELLSAEKLRKMREDCKNK